MKCTGMFAGALLSLGVVSLSFAQAYPTKPIRLMVPYVAGGGTDIIARPIAIKMGEAMGQAVIYENKGGGGGFLAAQDVARAAPDGYTLLVAATNTHIFATLLFDTLPFDPVKDFSTITNLSIVPNILAANPKFPAGNLKDLVAYAKANPGKINWASAGNASGGHVGMVLFSKNAGIQVVHVPFKGAGPAMPSLLSGETPLFLSNASNFLPNIKAGKLKSLGAASAKRLDVLPDVATFAEQGYALESQSFYGLVAPAKTPPAIINRLHDEAVKVLRQPEEQKRLAENGAFAIGDTPAQFAAFLKREVDTWAPVIKENNIRPD